MTDSAAVWYAVDVGMAESYINAASRSTCANEAYLFMKNEYVLLDYAPDTTGYKVLNGLLFICEYPSLAGTTFTELGIDCTFGTSANEDFIFPGNLCAWINYAPITQKKRKRKINYAPGTTDDFIIRGPMSITKMFPFFKGTVFENGVDAAFQSTTSCEAYLFKRQPECSNKLRGIWFYHRPYHH